MMPNGEVLAALCKALNQPADFFFRPFRVVGLKIIHWGNHNALFVRFLQEIKTVETLRLVLQSIRKIECIF